MYVPNYLCMFGCFELICCLLRTGVASTQRTPLPLAQALQTPCECRAPWHCAGTRTCRLYWSLELRVCTVVCVVLPSIPTIVPVVGYTGLLARTPDGLVVCSLVLCPFCWCSPCVCSRRPRSRVVVQPPALGVRFSATRSRTQCQEAKNAH